MNVSEQRKLFTSAEVCHACGLSKASLFRLEECGLLKPYRVNPDTGYRYYDLQNITTIGQIQRMQAIGLSKKEIADIYYEHVDSTEFLKAQRQKLSQMQRFLDEYEHRHNHAQRSAAVFVTLPAITCYCTEITASTLEEAARLDCLAHEKCIVEGYRVIGSEPLFGVFDNRSTLKDYRVSGLHFSLCIPVMPDSVLDAQIRRFPETRAFSMIGFGDYSAAPKLEERFWEEVDKRKLSPSGPMRFIMHIGAYAGAHYKPADYCYECVLPIKEQKE
ncbi:MAG: MerR family transcriptional regulator [Oscillospiraceae bacterium]|nr:MerR family transcriptional regulator [Oscillospiraceae bacterium]